MQNFINQAKGVKMTASEKTKIRSILVSLPFLPTQAVKSPYSIKSHLGTFGKALVAACLIIILSGGSLSYAAEKSLPGEFLYPVKTEFNEKIVEVVKVRPEDKLAWQEKRMERRLKEIDELKKRNKLDERAEIIIEKNLERQIKKVEGLKIKNTTGPQMRTGRVNKSK